MNYTTRSGHSVQFTRSGEGFDVHTRNAAGETVSTVWVLDSMAHLLMAKLRGEAL